MSDSPRVIFLESQEGFESLFTRGLASGAVLAGWKPELVFIADAAGNARSEKDVRTEILQRQPDAVCFLMDAPLDLKNLWDAPSLSSVDKISLWFDDYYRSPKTLANPGTWTTWQKTHGVRVGVWDGYWRCKWKELTGAEAFPVQLAADPRLLRPTAEPWCRAWSDRAAFIGTVPSLKSLEAFSEAFPAHMRRFLHEICEAMHESAWPVRPYDLAQNARSFLGIKYARAIDAALKDPQTLALWNHILWRWGKRIARLRGLAAVAKAGPIAIMSGHGTEEFAGADELLAALPGADMVFADTTSIPARAWKGLFQTGKFQVQVTDPQSIEGGLPFRVFECGACGVPLLSDFRPELGELFPEGKGITMAKSEQGLTEKAMKLFATPKEDLKAQGHILNEDFLANHTWEIRWRQLMQGRVPRSRTGVTSALSKFATPQPLDPHAKAEHKKLHATATGPINTRH